jgi:hypothetical protein
MADSPKEAEAAQALFCSIADYVGKNKIDNILNLDSFNTYYLFKKSNQKVLDIAYKQLDVPGISIQQIEKFLTDKTDWYQSSIIIAKKVIKSLSTIDRDFEKLSKPKWQNIFYVRGAKADKSRSANTMENIEALWAIANTNDKQFGDVNKWSPADIYYVSDNAREKVKQELDTLKVTAKKGSGKISESYDFVDLNKLINSLTANGDLLGLSLKKAIKTADLYYYNFDRKKDEKELADIEYYGVSQQWKTKYTEEKPITRDIQIYFSKDLKSKLKMRHDPSDDSFGAKRAIKAEIEVSGSPARGGSTASITIIGKILARVDKALSKKWLESYNTGIENYTKAIVELNKSYNITKGMKKGDLKARPKAKTGPAKGMTGEQQYERYKEDRIDLSGVHLLNEIMPVIYDWFTGNEGNEKTKRLNTKVLQRFIEYASSRSPQSGKFVIAKS